MRKNDNGYKIKTSLEFKTDKETKGKRRFTTGLFILVGIIMLACVCTLLLLKEYNFDIDSIIGRSPETTTDLSELQPEVPLEGKATFLFAVSDDACSKLHYVALFSADVSSGDIKICAVDVKKKFDTEKISGTLNSVFARSDGSMLSLTQAVSDVTGTEISRYVHATDASFKGFIKVFGGVPYNVKDTVRYACDGVGYIIEKGEQTLTADMSYKYMYYLSQQNSNKPEEMSSFLSAILKTVLTPVNFEKADSYYNRFRNILDTDISAFDYSNNKSRLSRLISLFDGKEAGLVETPDDL